eukprot:CAMPEP_0197715082 /NCGR_PEP_ID=MMETSP1434-20131217/260_1 /TAXON_ID=265543 /ORGANISM="Minutocellus polymorphus, Strain CCMP3303" /LENGTH=577 /DNA_ID=CAMNT_0043299089 /DNA_START=30 /DNA_END=1763 /DNA_ORIENTATION=-
MTRYAPLLLTATACAAAALSADARLVDPNTSTNSAAAQRRRRRAAGASVQGLPAGGDEFSRLAAAGTIHNGDENTSTSQAEEVERPVPGTEQMEQRAVPLDAASGPSATTARPSTAGVVAGAIAEATSAQAAEAEATAAACSPDHPQRCADLSAFGTTLFRSLLGPLLGGETTRTTSSSEESENILLSPLSIGQALALVSAGATPGSVCEAELFDVLGIEGHGGVPLLTDAILRSTSSSSSTAATAGEDDSGVSLTTASSIWLHGSIKASYEERAEIVHHATAQPLPRTYAPLNEWAELVSDGQIQNLFDGSRIVDPLMRAALINVVSFKGTWTRQFDASKTEVGVFYKKPKQNGRKDDAGEEEAVEEKVVKYMKDRRHVLLHPAQEELGDAIVMKLDYGPVRKDPERGWDLPSEFAALFVLPKDNTVESERAALDGLAQSSVTELIQGLRPREVNLSLPKFKLEFGTASLTEALRSMGLHEVFDGTKVLSAISDDPDLHLSDVLHKAVMEVTEEGTTAAAATAAMIMTRSVPPPPMDLEFNRPFFVMVVHVETGTPLFVGRVGDPNLSFEEDGLER